MNIVIYHSADYDGIFSAVAAFHNFGKHSAEYVGWNYGEDPIDVCTYDNVYVIDLNPECVKDWHEYEDRIVWIDHHISAIRNYPEYLRGLRIDGVAACRLAWQYFNGGISHKKKDYVDRRVNEPLLLCLVGEYDVWDKRDPRADYVQFGLSLYQNDIEYFYTILRHPKVVFDIIKTGENIFDWQQKYAKEVAKKAGFLVDFHGINFFNIVSPHARSSLWLPEETAPKSARALSVTRVNGSDQVQISLYHHPEYTHIDLSKIAVEYGGGGHKGACGFSISIQHAFAMGFLGG